MIRFFQIAACLFPLHCHAQFTYVMEESISVRDIDNEPLSMPWAGGLNAAQYNTMDLDLDGKDDLVLFDRTADKVISFLNADGQYLAAPQYQGFFPDDITNWLLLRDANCDGRKDIFTGNNLGIKVYMNITQPDGKPAWEHVLFHPGNGGQASEVLLTKGFSTKVNLQLQFDDVPAIVDADGDGDLDIFNVRFVGNGTVEYHQNFSMERYGTCDSLDFERITQSWGNFVECACGSFAFDGAGCPEGGRTQHAGGKSLLAFDADGDAKLDLLFSEATCTNLYFLKNEGTLTSPVIDEVAVYPPDRSVDFLLFPAAFYEDLDFDGVKDLIAVPNIFTKTYLQTDFMHSNWLYKNTGSNESPSFAFLQSDFLQSSMIDVGDNAVPAFADNDGDGDYDMFLSQNTSASIPATITLFENIGTASVPEFRIANTDMWEFSASSFYNLKIQFTDITRDNKPDLVFTATSLQTGTTALYFVAGTSQGRIDLAGQAMQATDFTIGSSDNIYVSDIDRDGLPDLLIGPVNGSLEWWKNSGGDVLAFNLEDESYLGLSSTVLRQNISCYADDLDGNGTTDLVYGDQSGKLFIVSDFREANDATEAISQIISNPISDEYESRNLGGKIWPTAVNLFSSTKPSIVVGNTLGGVTILRHQEAENLPEAAVIDIYPNPVTKKENVTLRITIDRPAFLETFSVLGQKLSPATYLLANQEYTYDVAHLKAGMYILRFTADKKTFSRRLVIR